ncbi:hypothetical protein ACFL29_02125 [Patescibacteria group bacterium]
MRVIKSGTTILPENCLPEDFFVGLKVTCRACTCKSQIVSNNDVRTIKLEREGNISCVVNCPECNEGIIIYIYAYCGKGRQKPYDPFDVKRKHIRLV